ncbi:unnamed protein product, partial [Ectocarpus sp. 8 AP-2014]
HKEDDSSRAPLAGVRVRGVFSWRTAEVDCGDAVCTQQPPDPGCRRRRCRRAEVCPEDWPRKLDVKVSGRFAPAGLRRRRNEHEGGVARFDAAAAAAAAAGRAGGAAKASPPEAVGASSLLRLLLFSPSAWRARG